MGKVSKNSLGVFLNAQVNADVLMQTPDWSLVGLALLKMFEHTSYWVVYFRKVCKLLENNANPNVRIVNVHVECVLTTSLMCVGGGTLA